MFSRLRSCKDCVATFKSSWAKYVFLQQSSHFHQSLSSAGKHVSSANICFPILPLIKMTAKSVIHSCESTILFVLLIVLVLVIAWVVVLLVIILDICCNFGHLVLSSCWLRVFVWTICYSFIIVPRILQAHGKFVVLKKYALVGNKTVAILRIVQNPSIQPKGRQSGSIMRANGMFCSSVLVFA